MQHGGRCSRNYVYSVRKNKALSKNYLNLCPHLVLEPWINNPDIPPRKSQNRFSCNRDSDNSVNIAAIAGESLLQWKHENKIFNWAFSCRRRWSPRYNNNSSTQTLNKRASFTRALLFGNKSRRQTLLCSYSTLIGHRLLFYLLADYLRLLDSFSGWVCRQDRRHLISANHPAHPRKT